MILSDGELLGMIGRGECFTNYFYMDLKVGTSLTHLKRQEEVMDWVCNSRRYNYLKSESEFQKLYKDFTNKFKKEQIMNTSDYRRGVEDATKPISTETYADVYVNATLEKRRKELLTKKVTKWVNIYQSNSGKEIQTGYKSLYDSKSEAVSCSKYPDSGFSLIGTYPIEIEISA